MNDSKSTYFWMDNWVVGVGPLLCCATQVLEEPAFFSLVKDFVTQHGDWDWQKINMYPPPLITNKIAGNQPPLQEAGADSIAWEPNNDGDFSLKSEYSLIAGDTTWVHDSLFKCIWKWRGPERFKRCL